MKKFLLLLLLGLAVVSLWSYYAMDGFKVITPHFAGECEAIDGDGSAEDIHIDPQRGLLFISAADRLSGAPIDERPNGTIAIYDANSSMKRFEMKVLSDPQDFHPHGLSLYHHEDGSRSLYVINHRSSGEDTVEVFSVDEANALHYVETIHDSLFVSANDLVVVGPGQFYLSNDTGATNGFEKAMETMGLINLSTIVFYNQGVATVAIDRFPSSGGIAANKRGDRLYIGGVSSKTVEVYSRNLSSNELTFTQTVGLNMGVDNIDVAVDGTVWVAGHPKVIDLIKHFISGGNKPSPSQVYILPVDIQSDESLLSSPIDLFTDSGERLSASSVAVEYQGRFYVGGITPLKMLVCEPG
ncbi:hypothetical protein OAV62_01735 [bacterium]|nr:hypothetical protein [bacterium]